MNIEQLGTGNLSRIDKSDVTSSRVVAIDVEPVGTNGALSSFASVLTALEAPVPGRPGLELGDPPASAGGPGDAADPAEMVLLLADPSVFLVAGLVSLSSGWNEPLTALAGQIDPSTGPGLSSLPAALSQDARMLLEEPGTVWQVPVDQPALGLPGVAIPLVRDRTAAGMVEPDAPATEVAAGVDPQQALLRGAAPRDRSMADHAADNNARAAVRDGDTTRAASESVKFDARAALVAQEERMPFQAAAVPDAASGGFKPLPGLGPRGLERISARSVFVPLDNAFASGGAASIYATNASGVPGAGATPDAPFPAGASSDVAHKVHYWVTRGAQNAELQLEAFGGGAVDVSISVRGNEAQVEFRSDQPDARRLLQDAMPQLRDLLRSEGLELAGGFVGGSAHRDAQRGQDDPNTGAEQLATIVRPGQTDGTAIRPVSTHAHALDIFV